MARYIESYPDYPGLLFLRALSELYTRDYGSEIIKPSLLAGYEFALSRYNISQDVFNKLFSWIAGKIVYLIKKDDY